MSRTGYFLSALVATWFAANGACAALIVDVGQPNLLPNQPNQAIVLEVSGGDQVTGFNLRAQLGDGLGPNPEPIFQAVDFSGGIWDAFPTFTSGGPVSGAPQYAQASVIFATKGQQVAANGTIVTLILDTTGIAAGQFQLGLKLTDIGADSVFIGPDDQDIGISVINNTLQVVPQPTWTGAGTNMNWSNAANWDSAAPVPGSPLKFGPIAGAAHADNTNDFVAGTSFNGITFTAGAPSYSLQGNAIALAGPVTNLSADQQTIDLDLQLVSGGGTFDTGATNITVTKAISGTGPLIKSGAGVLILSGTDSYTGGTNVHAGTLYVTNSNALPDGSSLTVGAGAASMFHAPLGSPSQVQTDAPINSVPEPDGLALLGVAVCGAAVYRYVRSRRKKQ